MMAKIEESSLVHSGLEMYGFVDNALAHADTDSEDTISVNAKLYKESYDNLAKFADESRKRLRDSYSDYMKDIKHANPMSKEFRDINRRYKVEIVDEHKRIVRNTKKWNEWYRNNLKRKGKDKEYKSNSESK